MPQEKADYSYRSAVMRYLVDRRRGVEVPVGLVLWNEKANALKFRLPEQGETVDGADSPAASSYMLAAVAKIREWAGTGSIPYATGPLEPLSDAWWEQVRRLMRFNVRIGPSHHVDLRDPDVEMDLLFEAVVQPNTTARHRASRVEGAVTHALGSLAKRLRRHDRVPGYAGRDVRVMRSISDGRKVVVVDAVNLAARSAEKEADATTSRLCRVKENSSGLDVQLVVGYLASPGGLNGEHALKQWMEYRLGTPLHDLVRDAGRFKSVATQAIMPFGEDPMGLWAPVDA